MEQGDVRYFCNGTCPVRMQGDFAVENRIIRMSNFRKAVHYLQKNGIRHTYYAAKERLEEERRFDYVYSEPSATILEAQRAQTADGAVMFSIVVPAFETKEAFLYDMMDSVCRQSYQNWELLIVDAGKSDAVEKAAAEYIRRRQEEYGENRIRYYHLAENQGISGNTNAGIEMAEGAYIALLDHDDLLAPDALYYMAAAVGEAGSAGTAPALLYTDEDKYEDRAPDKKGYYFSPHRKSDFNLDLLLSNNYVCHFTAVEAGLMKRLRLRGQYDGAQDYDLVLRVVGELLKTTPVCGLGEQMVHIPRILYHWRCHADSTAENTASKSYAYEAGKDALAEFCAGQGWKAQVRHSLHLGFYEITYAPDILAVRKDIGIVGGRILDRHGRICGGAYDEDGTCRYEGLHREYSGGSTHRASLKQDAAAVDIRCMRIRPELREQFEQITGCRYEERSIRCKAGGTNREIRIADISGLTCDAAGYRKISMELGRAARQNGYQVLWDPAVTVSE